MALIANTLLSAFMLARFNSLLVSRARRLASSSVIRITGGGAFAGRGAGAGGSSAVTGTAAIPARQRAAQEANRRVLLRRLLMAGNLLVPFHPGPWRKYVPGPHPRESHLEADKR